MSGFVHNFCGLCLLDFTWLSVLLIWRWSTHLRLLLHELLTTWRVLRWRLVWIVTLRVSHTWLLLRISSHLLRWVLSLRRHHAWLSLGRHSWLAHHLLLRRISHLLRRVLTLRWHHTRLSLWRHSHIALRRIT